MVEQGSALLAGDPNLDFDALIDDFLAEVLLFVIYSCALGATMLIFTYISIMLFNYSAHSQVIKNKRYLHKGDCTKLRFLYRFIGFAENS